jgi:microcystin-dependent protein
VTDSFVGEVKAFAFGFAPAGFTVCDGREVAISGYYEPLFRVIGNAYGGDGKSTFRLPDLGQCRIAVGAGAGPRLTSRTLGDTGGAAQVALSLETIPMHQHRMYASANPAEVSSPTEATVLARATGGSVYGDTGSLTPLSPSAVSTAPSDKQPHNNLMPYLVFVYGICAQPKLP